MQITKLNQYNQHKFVSTNFYGMLGHAELKFRISPLFLEISIDYRCLCKFFVREFHEFWYRALPAMNPKQQKDISSAIGTECSHINKYHRSRYAVLPPIKYHVGYGDGDGDCDRDGYVDDVDDDDYNDDHDDDDDDKFI